MDSKKLFFLYSLLSLLYERHQSLRFWFRRLKELLYFCRFVILFDEFSNIKLFKPAVKNLETGQTFLACTAIGKTQVMAEYPAVAVLLIKSNAWRFRH